jgi:catalase
VQEGARAAHAKGTWCAGTFRATPQAAALSRAAHFAGDEVPALIRFSNAGSNPRANDAARDARGMAVKLRPRGGEEQDILATTTPTFITRTPEEFLELLALRRPDPETGEPNMEKLGAFMAAHPESQTAIAGSMGVEPVASFATALYYSPHTFKLVNGNGNGTWIRYRWRPEAGEQRVSDDEARERGRDYLHEEIAERLASGPVRFELLLQTAPEGAALDDPTELWPDEPEFITAGALEITKVLDDPEGDGHIEVFDPTRVADGVELSEDPVLLARRHIYSVSAYRRLGDG